MHTGLLCSRTPSSQLLSLTRYSDLILPVPPLSVAFINQCLFLKNYLGCCFFPFPSTLLSPVWFLSVAHNCCTLMAFATFFLYFDWLWWFMFIFFARLSRQDLILNSLLYSPSYLQWAVRHWNQWMIWGLGIVVSYLLSDISQCFPQTVFIGLVCIWWRTY